MIYFGYVFYLSFAIFLVIWVGRKLHRDGEVWLTWLFDGHQLGVTLNNLLLLGYYLVNIGYSVYTLTNWNEAHQPLLEATQKIGSICLILSYLHYQNIIGIYFFQHFKILEQWK